jgi:hypothetical protein
MSHHPLTNIRASFGSPNNKVTQTNSAIIAAIKPSMEYAKLCMSMRLGNARYSAEPVDATGADRPVLCGGRPTFAMLSRRAGGDARPAGKLFSCAP